MIVVLLLHEMERKAGLAHLGLSTHASVSMWTLGDAFQFGNRSQVAFWVDPGPKNRDVDSGLENSVSFFFTRNLETLTDVL